MSLHKRVFYSTPNHHHWRNTRLTFVCTLTPHTPLQVELPAGSSRVTSVSCGGSHTLAVDDQKRALCCGKNEHGRLGLGPGAWKNKLTFEVGLLQLAF